MVTLSEIWNWIISFPSGNTSTSSFALASDLQEIFDYLRGSRQIELAEFRAAGQYFRFDQKSLGYLRECKDRVLRIPREKEWRERNNFLVWSPPGAGKTSFVSEIAREGEQQFNLLHIPIDLKDVRKRADLETQIDECRKSLDNRKSVLVTVDEWDRQVEGQQVFEMFHGPLEWNESQGKEVIWIFIASGKTKEDLVQLINNSPKGTDVYRRLGNEKEYQLIIPALTAGDKVIIGAAKALDFKFVRAEATALMTIALDPSLDSCGAIEKRIRDIHRSNSGTKLLLKDHFLEVSELTQFYKRYEQIFTQLDKVIDIMVRLA